MREDGTAHVAEFRTRTVQDAWIPTDLAEAAVARLTPYVLLRAVLSHTKEITK